MVKSKMNPLEFFRKAGETRMKKMRSGVQKAMIPKFQSNVSSGQTGTISSSKPVGNNTFRSTVFTVNDAPPAMSNKQKEKWVQQQNAIKADRDNEMKLRTDPVYKAQTNQKAYEDALARGRDINYANPNRGAGNRSSGSGFLQLTGSGKNFAEGCVEGNDCNKRKGGSVKKKKKK